MTHLISGMLNLGLRETPAQSSRACGLAGSEPGVGTDLDSGHPREGCDRGVRERRPSV